MSDSTATTLGKIETRLTQIEKEITEINEKMKGDYFTRLEATALDKRLEKVEKIIWWVISIVMGAFIMALLSVVIINVK